MNRLEMSQYLSNGPLGKVNNTNLRILKCPGNPDAQVTLSIAIIEQVELQNNRPSRVPDTDEESS